MSILVTQNITLFNDNNLEVVKRVDMSPVVTVDFSIDKHYIVATEALESIEVQIKLAVQHANYDKRKARSAVLQVLKARACYILTYNDV